MSSVKAAAPSMTLAGAMEAITGIGLSTANVTAGELPPPGAALVATRFKVPGVARSAADNATEISVADVYVTVRAPPFTVTADMGRKPVPVISTSVAPVPARTIAGCSEVIAGTGLLTTRVEAAPLGS